MPLPRILVLLPVTLFTASGKPLPPNGFLESEQPFLRSALIVSETPPNRVRRGVILPLGNELWTCFDPDLLRYAVTWKTPEGEAPLSMDSMASISYPDEKAKAEAVPILSGEILTSSPELPGAGIRSMPEKDIREGELIGGGKVGPMPAEVGRFLGLALSGERVVIEYKIGQRHVREMVRSPSPDVIERMILVLPGTDPIALGIVGDHVKITKDGNKAVVQLPNGAMPHLLIEASSEFLLNDDQKRGSALLVPAGTEECLIRILRSSKAIEGAEPLGKFPESLPAVTPFPGEMKVASPAVQDMGKPIIARPLTLPDANPWKRAIRPTDIVFLPNGDALITTLDGDVWRVKDIGAETATWSRAAFGIFELMSIATGPEGEVFVLGRDQITRLEDSDGDGHFDIYACASDAFLQTLHTRDYATSLEVYADGSFIIARSGLADYGVSKYGETTPDRGSVLAISPDGLRAVKLADGLRLPFIGIAPGGAIYASDQQGNFIPSTPLHLIAKPPFDYRTPNIPFLGYEPANFRKIQEPVPPLLWFPYQINRSGASFATLSEKAFPSLGEAFAHLSWSGRIFPVVAPEKGEPFAWKLPLNFDFPILAAATNPKNGLLYATGIGISGYSPVTAKVIGLAEIREGTPFIAPVSLNVSQTSIVVGFRNPLPSSLNLIAPHPELDLWNIQRTNKYGSGHYRWDGTPGQHSIKTGKLTVSEDRLKITIEVPPIFRSEILRLHLRDTSTGHDPYAIEIYARPQSLPLATKADLVEVAAREKKEVISMVSGDKEKGAEHFKNYGCAGCHSLDGAKLTGPPLNGIASRYKDDLDAFLKTSILDPAAVIAEGYEPSMPSFTGVILEQDIAHILAYLKSLE